MPKKRRVHSESCRFAPLSVWLLGNVEILRIVSRKNLFLLLVLRNIFQRQGTASLLHPKFLLVGALSLACRIVSLNSVFDANWRQTIEPGLVGLSQAQMLQLMVLLAERPQNDARSQALLGNALSCRRPAVGFELPAATRAEPAISGFQSRAWQSDYWSSARSVQLISFYTMITIPIPARKAFGFRGVV
jgi:hypothetical protein